MSEISLNSASIEKIAAARISHQRHNPPNSGSAAITRRHFIQSLGAVAAALSSGAAHAASFSAEPDSATLYINSVAVWIIETAWLAGDPVVKVAGRGAMISVSLSGARYPGTDLCADFCALVLTHDDTPTLRLSHALARDTVDMPLMAWLEGKQALIFQERQPGFSGKVGQYLKVRQLSPAQVQFSPALALAATAPGGWRLDGTDFTGTCDAVTLARPSGPELIDAPSLLRTHLVLQAPAANARMAPAFPEASHNGYAVGSNGLTQIRVEQAEEANGRRHQAFLAQGNGAVLVEKTSGNEADPSSARVLARDPIYARSLSANGASQALWLGDQGQAVTPFGQNALVSAPAADSAPIRLTAGTGPFHASCCAHPHSLSIASDPSVSISVRFPQSPGSDGKLTAMCPFTFSHKELALDGAEITFKRPDNALLLRFRLDGFTLVRNWKGISLRCTDACRVTVLPGAQSVLEQAFYVKPKMFDKPEDPAALKARVLTYLKEKYAQSKAPASGLTDYLAQAIKHGVSPASNGDELSNARYPARARVSGQSQLVYKLAAKRSTAAQHTLDQLSLSLDSLLHPELWELVVVQDAASSEEVRQAATGSPRQGAKDVPPADATYLELPTSLYISPDEQGRFYPVGLNSGGAGYHDLFRIEGNSAQTISGMPLRAIGSRGFTGGIPEPHYDPNQPDPQVFRTSLDGRDRTELVWLSSQWNQQALLGTRDVRLGAANEPLGDTAKGCGIYVPRAFHASKLLLASLGGSMKSFGRWDPPSLTQARFALGVERWEHCSTGGRLCHEVVAYKGFLLPLGIRAALIKVTERKETKVPELGVMSAQQQKFFIEILDPVAKYSESLAPYGGRTWPFRQIELELRGRLQIDDPTNTQLCGLGQSAFKICVGGSGYPFLFDVNGNAKSKGSAKLVLVDNTVAHNLDEMKKVTAAFNQLSPDDWALRASNCPASGAAFHASAYAMQFQNAKIEYAPPKLADDTSYVTTSMQVRLGLHEDLVNSAVIEASGKPPTYAEMEVADIVIPAINRLTGADGFQTTAVMVAPLYRRVGFDQKSSAAVLNESEVFLKLVTPIKVSFSGRGDRAGAVGQPDSIARNLARTIGLMGEVEALSAPAGSARLNGLIQRRATTSKLTINAGQLFSPDAKLLGVLPMTAVFDVLGLDEVPKFIESARHQLDAVAEDFGEKACAFVNSSKDVIATVLTDLRDQAAKFESLAPLLEHATQFQKAIAAIPCAGRPDIAAITLQIGVAGQALDNARRCAENLMQNPALLLPSEMAGVIAEWTSLVARLTSTYDNLKAAARAQLIGIEQALRAAIDELANEAGTFASEQLNAVCSILVKELNELVATTLPTERQFEQFFTLYTSFRRIYLDVVGLYRDIGLHWGACQKTLSTIAKQVILSGRDHFIGVLTAALRDPLIALDNALREWPPEEYEMARAFYRRVEPAVDALAASVVALSKFDGKDLTRLAERLESLRRNLRELETALAQPVLLRARANTAAAAYRDGVRNAVLRVRKSYGEECMALKGKTVQGLGDATVQNALVNLRDSLTATAKALPTLLSSVLAEWERSDASADYDRVIEQTIFLVNLCVIIRSRELRLGDMPLPDGYALCPPSIIALHARLLDTIQGINDQLLTWIAALIPAQVPPWLLKIQEHAFLFGPEAVDVVKTLVNVLHTARNDLKAGKDALQDMAGSAFLNLVDSINKIQEQWRALAAQLQRIGEAPDRFIIARIERSLTELASQLIPAEIHLDFAFNTDIDKSVSIFEPGLAGGPDVATLALSAHIRHNVLQNSSSSEFRGRLTNFRLDLKGFLTISFSEVAFEAISGSGPKLYPPKIADVTFGGCLAMLEPLKSFFAGPSGPYILPRPNGIKAGYRLSPGSIPLGPMILENLVIDAGIEIPFDDRAAVTTFSVSSRKSPALLFIAPYGGAMFFGVMMAGDRLVSIEASFEAGLVAAFTLGPVKGDGRITMGFYFRQNGEGVLLSGFFFAGGAARILGVVSITVALRISLIYGGDGGSDVRGHGEFSVEVGCSPFEWTLDYSIDYDLRRNMLAQGRGAPSDPDKQLIEQPPMAGLFLHKPTWEAFQSAFAKEIPCPT